MDAAPLAHRDARRCARPGCADVASATLTFRYDLQQAWVLPLTDEASPATYDLCGPCADRTRPPRGWELVDERPDLDGGAVDVDQDDAVRSAIAAALRGQGPALAVVPDAAPEGNRAPQPSGQPHTGDRALRAVPDDRPATPPAPAPVVPMLVGLVQAGREAPTSGAPVVAPTIAGSEELIAMLREHQGVPSSIRTGASAPAPGGSASAPLAFDSSPERFVSLGLEQLGDFDEEDLVAGLRDQRDVGLD